MILFLAGCAGPVSKESPTPAPPASIKPAAAGTVTPLAKVTDRPSNHEGEVLIVEYHKIAKQEARWDRSEARFRADLARLYSMGFRPVTLRQYVSAKMPLAPGASPIVFTFDDANPTQFKILPDGKLDPSCALGIWQDFASKHADFPIRATFFVLPDTMWGQPKLVDDKLALLKKWGCEVGSHTMTHPKLSHLTDQQAMVELAGAIDFLKSKNVDQPVALALPYGISPKNASLTKSFSFKGQNYSMYATVLVGANPAPAPSSPKLNLQRIPRIQGIEGENGITFWLDRIAKGKVKPYVE